MGEIYDRTNYERYLSKFRGKMHKFISKYMLKDNFCNDNKSSFKETYQGKENCWFNCTWPNPFHQLNFNFKPEKSQSAK